MCGDIERPSDRCFAPKHVWRYTFSNPTARLGERIQERSRPRTLAGLERKGHPRFGQARLPKPHQQINLQLVPIAHRRDQRGAKIETCDCRPQTFHELERLIDALQRGVEFADSGLCSREIVQDLRLEEPLLGCAADLQRGLEPRQRFTVVAAFV